MAGDHPAMAGSTKQDETAVRTTVQDDIAPTLYGDGNHLFGLRQQRGFLATPCQAGVKVSIGTEARRLRLGERWASIASLGCVI